MRVNQNLRYWKHLETSRNKNDFNSFTSEPNDLQANLPIFLSSCKTQLHKEKNMNYYKRLRNEYDRNAYESIEDKTERFLKALEKAKVKLIKAEYEAEKRKDQEVMKYEED